MAFGRTKAASYNYDDNGYPIHNAGRDISWTPFDKAKSLTQDAYASTTATALIASASSRPCVKTISSG